MKRRKDNSDRALIKICGSCREVIGDDKYCRYCGAEASDVKYEPADDVIRCVYGPPPVERKHTCTGCGYTWSTMLMIDSERYCPECGSEVTVEETGRKLFDEITGD